MRPRTGTSLFASAVVASAAAHALLVAGFRVIPVGSSALPLDEGEAMVVYAGSEPEELAADEFDIGRPLASGYATHEVDDDREQVAREAPQDQPQLSLDPVGQSVLVDVPSAVGYAPPAPAQPAVETRLAPPVPLAPAVELAAIPTPQASPPPVAPPLPQGAADPAPLGDSEVDAFSVLGSAQFRAGGVSVKSGRQVKTRRPKVGLAGMVELAQRSTVQVMLKVAIDATGKVTNVDVVRSSGSNEIDQPCRVAMYDWWFEPKKDGDGRAVPDVFRFTISFR